jgi:hypothetical protein
VAFAPPSLSEEGETMAHGKHRRIKSGQWRLAEILKPSSEGTAQAAVEITPEAAQQMLAEYAKKDPDMGCHGHNEGDNA